MVEEVGRTVGGAHEVAPVGRDRWGGVLLTGGEPHRACAVGADGVQSAEYVSREQAMAIFERDFGDGSQDFFDEPFLPPKTLPLLG
mgnify:CR=1 FL=1